MTEKLYYKDAYIKEFTASVISSEPCDGGFDTVLDKTAFFPEGGGQYSDKGYINGIRITDVREISGVIHHYSEEQVGITENAVCKIDFEERYEKMQCHTGEHILSGIIHSLHGLDNVGFHLGGDDVTMDISAPLTREELDRVEGLANEVIYKNLPVLTYFPDKKELSGLNYRSKKEFTENVRLVEIENCDRCACCAPHVKNTGEIGVIKILDFAKMRGGIRIRIVAGRRAYRVFSELFKSAAQISAQLSYPREEILFGVEKMLDDISKLRFEVRSLRLKDIEREAEAILSVSGNKVILLPEREISELIAFSNIAISKISGILVLLSGNEGEYKYVISSNSVNLKEEASKINNRLLGRGGGKPNMIQGSFSCSLKEIEDYFSL
jgi:alanyl-tRNA synthetase